MHPLFGPPAGGVGGVRPARERSKKDYSLIWKHTHRDFKGVVDGVRMVNQWVDNVGTCSVPLTILTDAQFTERLESAKRAEARLAPVAVEVSDYDRRNLEASNYSLEHTDFELVPLKKGFKIKDRDIFNPWRCEERFATKEEAVVWARRAHAFKTGHRQNGDLCKA